VLSLYRGHLENRWTGREYLDQRKSQPAHLIFNGAFDRARCLHNLLGVSQANALDVDRRFERGQQFAHVQRIAFSRSASTIRRGRALLPDESGRRGLAASHAIDGVVDEDHGNMLTAIGRVQNLG